MYGLGLDKMRKKLDPVVRFFRLVQEDPETGCWIWLGARNKKGYGRFDKGYAHIFSYTVIGGKTVPVGHELDHFKCRNPGCVYYGHVEPVTHLENVRRGEKANRVVCIAGHPFTPENTKYRKNGTRCCKECDLRRDKQSYMKYRPARITRMKWRREWLRWMSG